MKQNDIRLVLLLGLLAATWVLRAQPGGWSVNSADFQFSMSMVARIETGGAPNNALDNHVAAFSGGQIRGYATPIQIGDQAYYFFNLYANTYLNDSLYFLAFVGAENRVYESTDTVVFLHQKLIGDIQNPFVLHFMLSPKPLIYSLANLNYFESNCTPGPLLDVQASDDQDSEGNGLKYHIVGGADSSRFQLDSLTGILNWKNFVPDFENPQDADANNSYVLVVRVKDLSGNQSTQTITIQVKDDPIPTAGCPPSLVANTSDDGTGDCSTTVTGVLSVTIPTGCATYPVSYVLEGATTGPGTGQLPANQVFGAGKTTVRYTVTDESGAQSSACSFTVTVTDDEDPALTCPANIDVNTDPDTCIAVPAGTALSVADNCTNLQITFTLSGAAQGTGTGQLPVDQAFLPGVTTVTYSVRDDLNQPATTCSFTVTVTDNVPPAVTCPDNISVTLSTGCSDTQTATAATVNDNCSGVVLSYQLSGATNASGAGQILGGQKFQAGLTTAVYTATDGAGQSSCSFTILLRETKKPGITCPADASIPVTANCEASLPDYLATVEVSDNCTPDTALVLEQSPLPGTMLQGNSMTTVQLTATDLSGNSKSCTFKVTVADLDAVQITCPPNQEVCNGVLGNYVSLATVMTGCTSSGTPTVVQTPAADATIPAYNGQTTVTLTATDGPSTSSCMFVVRWTDSTPPTANCKNTAVTLQTGAQATLAAADVNNNSSDNCGIQSLVLNTTSFDCDDLGDQTVTLTVTDVHGLTATCTATVTLSDPSGYCCAAPQAICKTSPTLALDNAGQASITVAIVDNGSTYECGLQSISVQPTSVGCGNIGAPVPVTLTVVDISARLSTCMTNLTVLDTSKPVITCPENQIVFAGADCSGVAGAWQPASRSDNCTPPGSIAVGQNPAGNAILSGHNDTRTVTLTATDASLNTATCSFTVTLKDTMPPTVVCRSFTANLLEVPFVGSQATITAADVLDSGADNCGTISLGVAPNVFTCANIGINMVTLTATDQQGYTKTCQAAVNVKDVTPPKITCPANQTVSADENCSGVAGAWIPVSKSDNCTPSGSVAVGQTPAATTTLNVHDDARTVTLTATDASFNTATCSFTVTLKDVTAPTVVCKSVMVALNNAGVGSITPADVFQSGADNCGTVNQVSVIPNTFSCMHLGPNSVTLTVNDGHGNTQICNATAQVVDTQKPVFTNVPGYVTVECNSVPSPGTATATDNCGASVAYNGQTISSGACPDSYVIVRKWTATDGSGNTQTATQRITVRDSKAPVFTSKPAAVTVECSNIPAVGVPTATDNCDAGVSISYDGQTSIAGTCPDSYILTRQWTAVDNCGNTKTATQRITVRDTKTPVFITVPPAVTVECSNIPAIDTPAATDNCDNQVTIDYLGQAVTAGACPDTYVLTRTWRATDNCGNAKTATQKITVRDLTKPVFTGVPGAVTVECSSPLPPVETPVATDNCDLSVTVSYLGESGTTGACANSYTLVRLWRATDNCGNMATVTQVITVQDTQMPTFTSVPEDVTIECSSLVPPIGNATASDACGGYVQITFLGQTSVAGNCPNSYVITRVWRAQDECGNSATASQHITVEDTEAPVFNNPPPSLVVDCDGVPGVPVLTAQDACGPATVTYLGQTQTPGDCETEYSITRTWTTEDVCGNVTTVSQTILVMPLPPVIPDGQDRNGAGNPEPVFTIRPNPTTDWVTVELKDFAGKPVRLAVYNLLGAPVWEQELEPTHEPTARWSMRQAGLSAGLYTLVIETAGERQARYIVLTF